MIARSTFRCSLLETVCSVRSTFFPMLGCAGFRLSADSGLNVSRASALTEASLTAMTGAGGLGISCLRFRALLTKLRVVASSKSGRTATRGHLRRAHLCGERVDGTPLHLCKDLANIMAKWNPEHPIAFTPRMKGFGDSARRPQNQIPKHREGV